MEKITKHIAYAPGMPYDAVAAQLVGKEAIALLVAKENAVKVGKQLGFSDEDIEAGIAKVLCRTNEIYQESPGKVHSIVIPVKV